MADKKNCTNSETKIYDSWIEKELMDTELTLDMTLEDAYNCIKDSYIHHKSERNAIYLPKAELIALTCIKKVITENNKRTQAEWKYYKNNGIKYIFKCTNCHHNLELTSSELNNDDMPLIDNYSFCSKCGASMYNH